MMNFNLKRVLSIIAIWAILFASVAPTISHAFFGKPNSPWQTLCTAQGFKQLGDTDQAPVKGASGHLEQCPFCNPHVAGLALVSATPVFSFDQHTSRFAGGAYLPPVVLNPHLLSHPSQAPPLVS